jgi:hypothetical protein
MSDFVKTTPQPQAGKKPNWRCGAPAGNRNAAKPVHPLSQVRALQRRIRQALRACAAPAKQPQ